MNPYIKSDEIRKLLSRYCGIKNKAPSIIYYYVKTAKFPLPVGSPGLGREKLWKRAAVLKWIEKRIKSKM